MITDREQKLRKALEWLINLHEDAINNIKNFYERDYQKCMELQVEYYIEHA